MNENLLLTDITIAQGNLIRVVVKSWEEIHRNVNYLMHDNWGCVFQGHDAAEVYSSEEH